MMRTLRFCVLFAGLGLFAAEMMSLKAGKTADDIQVSQRPGCRNCPRYSASYGRSGGRTMRGGIPGGRTYYNGRYYGNYNNRFYGPQYGYF